MSQFGFILTNIILPIFIIIGVGFVLHKKFKLHIPTLSKVQIYALVPALVFLKIYTSTLSSALIFKIAFYSIVLFLVLMLLSTWVSRLSKFERPKEKAFINAVVLRNTGNFGIPLITLLYAGADNDYAISIHMIVVITSTVLMYTIGLYNASSGKYSGKAALRNIKGIPTIYMILIAGGLRALSIEVPTPILSSVGFLSQGVVPVALIALGAQLSEAKFTLGDVSIYTSNAFRLVVSPVIAWLMCVVMKLDPVTTQVLVIGAGTPTAVNSLLLAVEFGGDADYASKTILTTTIMCSVTLSVIIFLLMT